MSKENEEIFNKIEEEITVVLKKYNAELGGCGCCGSPWIMLKNDSRNYINLPREE